jgi:hypothetical protein
LYSAEIIRNPIVYGLPLRERQMMNDPSIWDRKENILLVVLPMALKCLFEEFDILDIMTI